MSTFVTGGTGFLGVNLVRLLVERGKQVRLLVRPTSPRVGLDSKLIQFVEGDVTDPRSVAGAMRGCDEVYHLAAWVQISPWGWSQARRINVEGTRHLCQAALDHGVRRVVHTSSIASMGTGSIEHPANEETKWNLRHARSPYHQTKLEAEGVVQSFVQRGLDVVIVNPTYVVGPWDIKPSAGRALLHAAKGHVCVYPSRGGINYVDVRKAVAGMLLAMQKGRTGQRYILGGENLTFKDYLTRAARIAGVSPPRLALPYAVAYPFAAAGSFAGRVFPKLFRDVNQSILDSAFIEHFVSSEKARLELEYEVVPVDAAITDALDWFVEHGYLKKSRTTMSACCH